MKSLVLGHTSVGPQSPYIIAEIGVNHEGSLDLAKELIRLAKEGGANAAKFQSYKAEKIASKNSPSYWDLKKEKTQSQFELFKKYDGFEVKDYEELARYCKELKIDFLSTPFDLEAVDFLNPLMPLFKIASADITNDPLLKKVAAQQKPVLISTGCSRLGEIERARRLLLENGASEVVLLHCVLNYPTPDAHAHLNMIDDLKRQFPESHIGYSDHTVPDAHMTALSMAYLKGAYVIEKHFTHDKALPGNDHYHAMDVNDLKIFRSQIQKYFTLGGVDQKMPLPEEALARKNARRSFVIQGEVEAGAGLSTENLIAKRPAFGVSPIHWELVQGARVNKNLTDDHILTWEDLELSSKAKIVVVIQARMGSQRLPQKMSKKLGGKPLFEWVFSRVKQCQKASQIVLATSDRAEDDFLFEQAQKLGLEVVRGSNEDVLSRFQKVQELFPADAYIRVCADNPFVDPQFIDALIEHFQKYRSEYIFNHIPKLENGLPDGFGAELVRADILAEVGLLAQGPQREHITQYVWDHAHAFEIVTLKASEELHYPDLKFDIDTAEDLQRLEPIASKVGLQGRGIDFVRASQEIGN